MMSRRTRTMLPTPDHLLEPMSINRDAVSAEIMVKRNTSKAHYDKTAGPEHNIINIGEFVYDHRQANRATHGRMAVPLKNATQDLTPYKRSTVPFDEIGYTSGVQHLLLLPQQHLALHLHSCLAHHYNSLGSELNTPTDQPKQQLSPSTDTSNSGPDLDTSSPLQPQEPSTPDTGQSEPSTDTPPVTIQDQQRDHQNLK